MGRGFAGMTPEQRTAIARLGGKAAQEKGVAHRWDSEEAKLASAKAVAARQDKAKA